MSLGNTREMNRALGPSHADLHHAVGPSIITAHRLMHDEWRDQMVQEAQAARALAGAPWTSRHWTFSGRPREFMHASVALLSRAVTVRGRLVMVGAGRRA